MQRLIYLWVLLIMSANFSLLASNRPATQAQFELVESIPQQTNYGEPGVRTTLQVWLDMVKGAHKTIDIASFYINSPAGKSLAPWVAALTQAAARGVRVRILLDTSFAKQSVQTVQQLQKVSGIEIRYMPMKVIDGGVMHAKYMLVDLEDVFVGSPNFDWKAINQIHEIGVRVRSHVLAATIARVFNMDWSLCQRHDYARINHWRYLKSIYNVSSMRPCQVQNKHETLLIHPAFSPQNLVPQGLDEEQHQWIALLDVAKQQVLMQVLRYSPVKSFAAKGYWGALNDAIIRAAARGVKVKLIVSDWNLSYPAIVYLKSLSLLPNVNVKYSVIPPNTQGYLSYARVEHAKYMVVDNDLIWVGTGNWQWSYFHSSRNLALVIQGFQPNLLLSHIFWRDWKGPYTHEIKADETYPVSKHN